MSSRLRATSNNMSAPASSTTNFMATHKDSVMYATKVAVVIVVAVLVVMLISWMISEAVGGGSNSVVNNSVTQVNELSALQGVGAQLMSVNTVKTVPGNAWTTVASYSGAPGVIKTLKLNLSVTGVPDNSDTVSGCHFIAITFDGAATPQIGVLSSAPTVNAGSNLALNVDALFDTISAGTDYATQYFGSSNTANTTQSYQYMNVDMPFASSFTIQLYNNTISLGTVENSTAVVNVEWVPVNTVPPQRLFIKPSSTWALSTFPTAGMEYPLLSTSGPNGTFLKFVRMTFQGPPSGTTGVTGVNWSDATFRLYSGGAGMTAAVSTASRYTDSTNATPTAYATGAKLLMSSNDTADFFGAGPHFVSCPYSTNTAGGLIYNSNGENSATATDNATITAQRIFEDVLPSAPANTQFVVSYAVGNARTASTGTCEWVGTLGYYQ